MTPLGVAVRIGKLFGFHVSSLSKHPSHTLLGLAAPDLIIDVGANTGQFAQAARKRFPSARLICVEPLPTAFLALDQWAKADGNAHAINCAAGAGEAVLPLNVCLDYDVSSSLLSTTDTVITIYPQISRQAQIEVPVRRLDDILAEAGATVTERTLLKLDVQGFELQALAGAPDTLAKTGAVLTEVNLISLYDGQSDFAAIYDRARGAGLRYAGNYDQSYDKDGRIVYFDALFQR